MGRGWATVLTAWARGMPPRTRRESVVYSHYEQFAQHRCGTIVRSGTEYLRDCAGSRTSRPVRCAAIARQPEALNDIRANMILTAALVEGAALFAIIVGFLAMVL